LFVSGTRHFSIILFSKAFVFQLFTVIPPYVQLIWDFFIWSDLVEGVGGEVKGGQLVGEGVPLMVAP